MEKIQKGPIKIAQMERSKRIPTKNASIISKKDAEENLEKKTIVKLIRYVINKIKNKIIKLKIILRLGGNFRDILIFSRRIVAKPGIL